MIKSYFIILFINSFLLSEDISGLFNDANEFYLKKDYEKSAKIYENLIENEYLNSQVFYNLGNSYYRLNKIGQAVWAYRNAIKFEPRDKDIAHNLKVAEAQRVDRIISPPLFKIHYFYKGVKSFFTIFELSLIGGITFFILSLLWAAKRFINSKPNVLRNIFQFFLVIAIIIHIVILDIIIDRKKNENQAVITDRVDAMSSPSPVESKLLFYINEGALVELLDEKNQWMEIILIDGKRGWVPSNALRKMK